MDPTDTVLLRLQADGWRRRRSNTRRGVAFLWRYHARQSDAWWAQLQGEARGIWFELTPTAPRWALRPSPH